MATPARTPTIVVMGVSGVGKTTVAQLLAAQLGVPYAEADDFHPPSSIDKMAAGVPLGDEDRWPWLDAIGAWLRSRAQAGSGGVVTCSALRRRYRDVLRAADPDVFFLHLSGTPSLISARLQRRTGHFMPPELLSSQYATLEPLESDEHGIAQEVGPAPEELAARAMRLLPG